MVFLVIDKTTQQIGIYDCSDSFYSRGEIKVKQASEVYDLFYKNPDFVPDNYFINETL